MTKKLRSFLAAGAFAASAFASFLHAEDKTVKVGVLHDLSGTMAFSETSLRDILLFTIDEINAKGGVLGKKIVPDIQDPGFRLAHLRRKGETAAGSRQGGRNLRLLDFGEPQVLPAGL